MLNNRAYTPSLSIVVPMYNERDIIRSFFERVEVVLDRLVEQERVTGYEIICVNDGSTDDTAGQIKGHRKSNPQIKLIDLSRNFGKEAALTAGLNHTRGDVVVVIDADLEEPPDLIDAFMTHWQEGYDVVYGARASREHDTFSKQVTAKLFYRIFNMISDRPIPADAGDFRLMDRAVVDIVNAMPERNRFMKGIFSWPGFHTKAIPFHRQAREAGETKFSPFKLLGLAFSGIISFSLAPIRLFIYLGILISILAFIYLFIVVGRTLVLGIDEPGYASLMSVLLFLGGIQVLGLGIIGEYIGRVYVEVKGRPIYIIKKRVGFDIELSDKEND